MISQFQQCRSKLRGIRPNGNETSDGFRGDRFSLPAALVLNLTTRLTPKSSMTRFTTPFRVAAQFLALVSVACTTAAQNDPGSPTSNNNEIQALPAPGPVVIDGKDNDWDLSAGIWSYNDPTLVNKYSVWTHLMWDEKGVYLLGRYADLSPMKNATRGEDFIQSWQADAFQGRVIFDDKTDDEHQMHINLFYSSAENAPYMIVKHGGFKKTAALRWHRSRPSRPAGKIGHHDGRRGGKIAFQPWDDGKGYNMEVFWPWSYLRTTGSRSRPVNHSSSASKRCGATADGTKMIHRLVDNLKDDKVNRIFFFRAREGWGRAVLSEQRQTRCTDSDSRSCRPSG